MPETLDEALNAFDEIDMADLSAWIQMSEEHAIVIAHHGVGRLIRNEWHLWRGGKLSQWFNERGVKHADDMSSIILTSLHRKKNGKDIDLEGQIVKYRTHWEKHDTNML